jgi:hypothetical protein
MSPISRKTAGGRAYIDLQRRAKNSRRNTQELIQLYILEGFLARLSHSPVSDKLVLKGGVLLAAFGNRRPTRDVDLAGQDIGNDEAPILALIKSILDVQLPEDDGIEFASDTARSEVIREDDEYSASASAPTPRSPRRGTSSTPTSASAIQSSPAPPRSPCLGCSAAIRSLSTATRYTWCTQRRSSPPYSAASRTRAGGTLATYGSSPALTPSPVRICKRRSAKWHSTDAPS